MTLFVSGLFKSNGGAVQGDHTITPTMYLSAGVITKISCLCAAATGVCLVCLAPQLPPPDEFCERYRNLSTSPGAGGYLAGHPVVARLLTLIRFDYNAEHRTSFLSYLPYLLPTLTVFMSTFDILHTLDLFPQIMPVEHTTGAREFNGQLTIGLVLTIASSAARLITYRNLGRFYTFRLSIQPDHKLITHGSYSYVRHPSYTAVLTLIAGVSLTVTAQGSVLYDSLGIGLTRKFMAVLVLFVAFCTHITVRRGEIEDQVLRKVFGKEWEEWALVVRYKLIPGIL